MNRPVVPPPITDTVAPLGPNARAMLEERLPDCRCGHRESGHGSTGCVRCRCDGWAPPIKQPSPRPTVTTRELQAVLRETLLVLREQGVPLTDKQIEDRVGNGVMKILGLFEINYVGE